ncbi:AAA family ATPase [Leifsonia sp. NPDC058248]|uniref:MinD/ParA family ATP-binding protein n=1 Tax=Leifsonia sp. NPDC058248 TaxID=3346402 RepID=UPI0036D7D87C
MTLDIPAVPLITARFGGDRSGELSIDGISETFSADSTDQVREAILARVSDVAVELGRPVRLITEDDEGQWLLVVHASGEIGEEERLVADPVADADERAAAHPHRADELPQDWSADSIAESRSDFDFASLLPSADEAPRPAFEDILDPHVELDTSAGSDPLPAPTILSRPETGPNPALRIETEPEPVPSAGRASFLTEERTPDRARKGWRGLLAKTGLPIPASTRERVERDETHAVSQHWAGPRTIAIVNGKGGANKTPTTAMLAAVFARSGGSGVLAWDNNETRGTLGWRTEQGLHDATVQTLLPNTEHLLSPAAQSSDLSHFVHHQTGDKYDVLRSNPAMLATEQRITTDDFDKLHSVVAKYFRLIFIDSGNDESADRWLRMIDHTDQLVIATTALGEHAEAGALLLEALAQRDERSARLASGAVVIVSQSEKSGGAADARRVADGFESLARRAVSVPFDPAMHGGRLEYSALSPASRRAWLHAAAAVAEGL